MTHDAPASKLNFIRACTAVAVLFPLATYASFGGAPCRDDFACHFFTWGVLLGTVGVPASGSIFGVLHLALCHNARSKLKQFFVGCFIGMVAYEISVAAGALIGTSGRAPPGRQTDYLLMGMASVYVVLAIASVLYARSSPRRRPGGEDPHAG